MTHGLFAVRIRFWTPILSLVTSETEVPSMSLVGLFNYKPYSLFMTPPFVSHLTRYLPILILPPSSRPFRHVNLIIPFQRDHFTRIPLDSLYSPLRHTILTIVRLPGRSRFRDSDCVMMVQSSFPSFCHTDLVFLVPLFSIFYSCLSIPLHFLPIRVSGTILETEKDT